MIGDFTSGTLYTFNKVSETINGSVFILDGSDYLNPTTLTIKHTTPPKGQRFTPQNAPVVRRLLSVNVPHIVEGLATGKSVTVNVTIAAPIDVGQTAVTDAFATVASILANADVTPAATALKFLKGEQ